MPKPYHTPRSERDKKEADLSLEEQVKEEEEIEADEAEWRYRQGEPE